MHHFKAIVEFKLDFQSGSAQFGTNWRFFVPCDLEIWWMTMKTIGHLFMLLQDLCIISLPSVKLNWSYIPEKSNFGQNWWFYAPCDLEIWQMTLKNDRAPLLCYSKLCALFHSHQWNQTGVTVGNAQFGSKSASFGPVWPWNLTDDFENY